MLAKLVALSLVILAASPFTAPFSTCNLFDLRSQPVRHEVATESAVALDGDGSVVMGGANETIGLAADPPADVRSTSDIGSGVLPLPVVTSVIDIALYVPVLDRPPLGADLPRSQASLRLNTVLRL